MFKVLEQETNISTGKITITIIIILLLYYYYYYYDYYYT